MKFQKRDGDILIAIHHYGGVLAKRQLKELFWPGATWRAMEMRLSSLHREEYLAWPSREQWQCNPISEPVCWIGWKGMEWLAGQRGIPMTSPHATTDARLKKMECTLKKHGVRWLREPRWSQLAHDLAVVDTRRAVEQAVEAQPSLTVEQWIPESEFRAALTVVEYTMRDANGNARRKTHGVIPDSGFILVDECRKERGLPARARFLLEVDMGTHDTNSFFQEKVLAGLAYVQSPAYKTRFGESTGRWLVVTTSEVRLNHLMRQAQRVVTNDVFLFSTYQEVMTKNVFTSRIWQQVGSEGRKALIAPSANVQGGR